MLKRIIPIIFLILLIVPISLAVDYKDKGASLAMDSDIDDCGGIGWAIYANAEYCKIGYTQNCEKVSELFSSIDSLCVDENKYQLMVAYALTNAYKATYQQKYLDKAKSLIKIEIDNRISLPFYNLANLMIYNITGEKEYLLNAQNNINYYYGYYYGRSNGWQMIADLELYAVIDDPIIKANITKRLDTFNVYSSYTPFAEQAYWYAIAYIKAYEITKNPSYLEKAEYTLNKWTPESTIESGTRGETSQKIWDLWSISWAIYSMGEYCQVDNSKVWCTEAQKYASAEYCLEQTWSDQFHREVKICKASTTLSDSNNLNNFRDLEGEKSCRRGKAWLSLAYLKLSNACELGLCDESVPVSRFGFPQEEVRYKNNVITTIVLIIILAVILVLHNSPGYRKPIY